MSDSINEKNNDLSIVNEYCKELNKFITEGRNGQRGAIQKPKIQTVPAWLRGQPGSEKYYEPRWMSIGPIHHRNPKYKLAEVFKFTLAAKFIRDGNHQSCEKLFDSIKNGMEDIDKFFVGEEVVKDAEWIKWLLFIDGCAVLEFIHSYPGVDGSGVKKLRMKNDQVAFTQHDIFLLENQIPFQVLRLLMKARGTVDENKLKRSVLSFINMNVMAPRKYKTELGPELLDQEPLHLLDLLLSVVVGKLTSTNPDPGLVYGNHTNADEGRSSVINIQTPPGLANSNQTNADEGSSSVTNIPAPPDDPAQQSFRSVTDLKLAGINLKPSATYSLRDVHFSYIGFVGTLQLPPLIVDDLTGSKFLNLIAYEMCPDNTDTKYEVTSYISFLDSLVDYPADVKELRSSQILYNFLGCDKDVALLFNKIATDLVPNTELYQHVVDGIEKHYKKRLVTWMAEVYNDHFSSPWTIVTFLAAVLALGLAIVDTWLNVDEKLIHKK